MVIVYNWGVYDVVCVKVYFEGSWVGEVNWDGFLIGIIIMVFYWNMLVDVVKFV